MKKYILIAVLAIPLFWACRNEEVSQGADVSVPVRVADIVKKPIFNSLTINGTVAPAGSIEMATEADGKYRLQVNPRTGKPFKMGDKVKAGETIILLENQEYEISIRIDAKKLDAKKDIDHAALKAAGLARGGKDGVRLLGKGELKAKVKFVVAGASKGAIEAVEKAGGSVEVTAPKKTAEKAD